MEFAELIQNLWVILMLFALVVCCAKGWLRKGFYMTTDHLDEPETYDAEKEERKSRRKKNSGK